MMPLSYGGGGGEGGGGGGSFEECDAAKPRKNVMQLTQVMYAPNKVHIERENVLQLNC